MKRISRLIQLCLIIFIPTIALAQPINKIDIKGNERISSATIEAYLDIKINDRYDQSKVDTSIKNLFATGFFSDIKVNLSGSTLVIEVEENALINQIAFEGNKRIKDDDLLKELNMIERSVFSSSKLQNDTKRIIALYQKRGRYTVKVEPKIIKLDQNRINLVYEINEGDVTKIQKILFTGNEAFSSQKLSRVILSQEERWYRFFSSSDVYDGDRLIIDQEFLKRFYFVEGYADFEVTSATAELSPKKDSFLITFVVHEGPIYKIGDIKIISKLPNIDINELYKLLEIKSEDTFNVEHIEKSVDRITDFLGDNGYAFVEVEDNVTRDKATQTANITITINETHKIYVNKINIIGNTRTLDKIIRREFRLAEGDPYNTSKVYRSKQRIKNLGFFNSVELKNERTDEEDKVDIDVEVQEKSTGALNFAAGYNTANGPLGVISLSESNFLGKGQEVGIEFMKAKKAADVSFSFTEPYFLDYPLSTGFDIFSNSQDKLDESSFTSKAAGFVLRAGYDLSEHLFHGVRYSAKKERIADVPSTASIHVKAQEGENTVSLIGHTLSYDRLDDRLDPTKGFLIKLSQDLAGAGGQTFYFKNQLTGAAYYPVYKKDVVLSLVARTGHITGWNNKQVRVNDHFFIGGDDLRGFDTGGIGPRDIKTRDALGGKAFYTGSAEVTFPFGAYSDMGIKGFIFTDFGSLFDPDINKSLDKSTVFNDHFLRASYGAGINWNSTIGNIRIYYGIPYRKKTYDERRSFSVSFGTRF